jgi:hypothetical protein
MKYLTRSQLDLSGKNHLSEDVIFEARTGTVKILGMFFVG